MTSRPNHPVLIVNPESGGGKARRHDLVGECLARGIEPVVFQRGDNLFDVAEAAVERGADAIGVAGGDGSQAPVATVAVEHDIAYVCVPAGTRNHFALDIGLSGADVVGALDAFSDAVERRVDLGRVNGRVFVNNTSIGLYAEVVRSAQYRDAKAKTVTQMLPDLIGPGAEPFDLRFTGPDGAQYPTAHLLIVSNNPYRVKPPGAYGTRGAMDGGTLGVVAARIAEPKELVSFRALDAAGRIRSFHGWLEWATPTFRVDSDTRVDVALDGEPEEIDPPLEFETLPSALRIRLPQHRHHHPKNVMLQPTVP
jgi:diacylglycerol kinase family enzyme